MQTDNRHYIYMNSSTSCGAQAHTFPVTSPFHRFCVHITQCSHRWGRGCQKRGSLWNRTACCRTDYVVGLLVVSLGTLRHVAAKWITQYNLVMAKEQSYLPRYDYVALLVQTTTEWGMKNYYHSVMWVKAEMFTMHRQLWSMKISTSKSK